MASLLVSLMMAGVVTSINVVTRTEDSLARTGSSLSLHCYTDRPWFLCVWTTEIGEKQFKHCAIQERRVSSVCAGDPRIVISGGDTRCSITINNVTSGDWGDWMCLVQDDVDFEKAEEHINVEVGKEAVTSLTWGGHQHDHDLGNKIENGTRYLRVIEDTVTRVECRVTRAFPRPRVSWFGGRDVSVSPVRSHVFGDSVTYDNVTHEYSLVSSVLYTASLNDTNSSLSCNVLQEDLYTTMETVTIIVDPKPLPLIKDNGAETAGIIAGVILAIIFLLLLLVIAIAFVIRRRRQRHRSESPTTSGASTDQYDSLKPGAVWSTRASGQGVENYSGGRYAGNWGKVIHGERGEVEGGSVNTTLDTGTGTKSGSLVSEDSFQTDRDLEQLSVSLRPGPSLPETHFGNEEPQTVLHHHSVPYLDTYHYKKPSSVRSADVMAAGRDSGISFLSSRPVSALDVYLPHYHVPMRVSTPTCAGSKSSVSMFQCPHDCFVEKDLPEIDEGSGDTIEEMDEEEDAESIRRLVNRGLDLGTDWTTDRHIVETGLEVIDEPCLPMSPVPVQTVD